MGPWRAPERTWPLTFGVTTEGENVKGIRERHSRSCRSSNGGRCTCAPSYEAQLWNPAVGKPVRRTFRDPAEAGTWLRDARTAVRRGRAVVRDVPSLEAAGAAWLEQAKAGIVRARGGHGYKPATVRGYQQALKLRAYPILGAEPLDEISRADIQALVDDLNAQGLAATTIETTVNAVRAIYRHEIGRDRLKVNPTRGVVLPSGGKRRERFATPAEARALIAAVCQEDKAVWATAFYAGLRRGELRALRSQAVDLEAGEIRVVAGWDAIEGEQPTKGRERRTVPIIGELRTILAAHALRTGRRGADLLFGATASRPFYTEGLQRRADEAWKAAKLERITPHECRHTFASIAIAAGVNIGTVSAALGHSSVTITWDRYHHLMPGTMDQAAEMIQGYIEASRG
jgi:integrase